MTKRLFLFAGYDKNGIVDDSLIYYVRALSKHGDVVLFMDSDCPATQIKKLKPYVVHAAAHRHGEYDFGSYKRAYQYARDKKLLSKYDVVYLVNDSVFGPTMNIKPLIKDIEKIKTDAAGITVSIHRTHMFMESWFIRITKKIFTSTWFDNFMNGVTKESNKADVTVKYEHGLTNLIKNNHCSWGGICYIRGRFTYNYPIKLFKRGIPFIKKMSFTRHYGALGGQIKYILKHCDCDARDAIMKTANRVYGEKYMNWFLTSNPMKIMMRNIKYAFYKIKNGGI